MTTIKIDTDKISQFCRKWKIVEFCLFGSVLRPDFGPESDIDILVSFSNDARWSLFDLAGMQEELQNILGRKVDILTRRGVESSRNYLRRREILSTAERIYAA